MIKLEGPRSHVNYGCHGFQEMEQEVKVAVGP